MAESLQPYRLEYISGQIVVPVKSDTIGASAILFFVVNRGGSEGLVRVFFYQATTPTPTLLSDVGDTVVPAQQSWFVVYEPVEGVPPGGIYVRVLTSSSDLVPSAVFQQGGTEGATGSLPFLSYANIQPGDFAVFDLPATVIPPPGPPTPPNA